MHRFQHSLFHFARGFLQHDERLLAVFHHGGRDDAPAHGQLLDPRGRHRITAGGREYRLLSESERYRVDAVLAEAVANLSGARLLVLDRADKANALKTFLDGSSPDDIAAMRKLLQEVDGRREFVFQPGPIFTNLLLADEINRATPIGASDRIDVLRGPMSPTTASSLGPRCAMGWRSSRRRRSPSGASSRRRPEPTRPAAPVISTVMKFFPCEWRQRLS